MKRIAIMLLLMLFVLTGCGGGKHTADFSLFMMPDTGVPKDVADQLETLIQERMGEDKTVQVMGSMISNEKKLFIEVAVGGHDMVIVGENNFRLYMRNGSGMPLEEWFDPEEYPDGIAVYEEMDYVKGVEREVVYSEEHLYGIPVDSSKLILDAGFPYETKMFAFIIPTKDEERLQRALEVLRWLAETDEQ